MEGPRYAFGDVKVSSEVAEISPDEYADALRLKSGQVYDPSKIQTNIQRLEQVATRNGLNFVKVEQRVTRNADTQTIDVEFVIQRGERLFVERIDIEGNTTTLDQVVRRQFDTAEGDAFNNSDVRRSAEKIRGLGFFSTAEVQALPGSSPDKVVVNVDLQEAPTGSLSFGVTYGTSSGAGVMLGFAETNLLGRGQALSLNVSATRDTQDYTFGFTEPAVLGRNLKFKLNGQFKNTEEASASYNTGIATISPALEFPINELSRLELRYRLAREGVVNSGSTSTIIIAEAARGQENLSSLGYTLNFDTRKMLDANGGVFEPLFNEQDAIISDALNHASIIDGVRLCKAQRFRYEHNNMQDLAQKLQETAHLRSRIIVTDGSFSMDGTIAQLDKICDLADQYNAIVMIDEYHSSGFLGKTGRGTHEHCGVMGRVDIITGTLGKALGGASG
ncbi:MAG: aminotransferase class I/II-fold pyridoxal phosphate-dependent enzyme, partial [Alphaproteobacteria bacterium]